MTSHEKIFGKRTESGEVLMTLDQELDQELINYMCRRFEQCDCLEALETSVAALQSDINCSASYTLVPGAIDKMRAAYKKRLDELKGQS